jgi:hypothetical protein
MRRERASRKLQNGRVTFILKITRTNIETRFYIDAIQAASDTSSLGRQKGLAFELIQVEKFNDQVHPTREQNERVHYVPPVLQVCALRKQESIIEHPHQKLHRKNESKEIVTPT